MRGDWRARHAFFRDNLKLRASKSWSIGSRRARHHG
ncbi:hypothetical protein MJ561_13535 [Klebsiella pneumoniae]|nr:hypothetical protein MJ561_13535 [Klebsiella pneumoniae]